jgi:hypothetical protein
MSGNLSTNQAYTAISAQTISSSWSGGNSIDSRYGTVATVFINGTMNATASLYVRFEGSVDGTNWAALSTGLATQVTASGQIVTGTMVDVREISASAFAAANTVAVRVEIKGPYFRVAQKIGAGITTASLVSAQAYLGGS